MMRARAAYWEKIVETLTDEEREWLMKARRRRLAGERKLTNAEIGAKIGKPDYWVSSVCLTLGSKSRVKSRAPSIKLTDADKALFAQMWADGATCAEISSRWGFTQDWATKWAERFGLPKRVGRVTNRQQAEIKRRLEAGESRRQVMQATGLSYGTIAHHAAKLKVSPRGRGRPSSFNVGLADRMARNGMVHKDIAAHFGVTRQAVSKAIRLYRKRLDALSAKKPAHLIPPVKPSAYLKEAA